MTYKHILIYMTATRTLGVLLSKSLLVPVLAFLSVGLAPADSSFAAAADADSMVVQAREMDVGFPAEANVEAVRQATVAAQVAGRVLEMRVDAGQRVRQGDVLLRIDAREAAGSDASARAALAQAGAAYERTRNLHSQRFVSQLVACVFGKLHPM